jgi:cold shock CspA family protein
MLSSMAVKMNPKPTGGAMLWFNEEKGHGFIATDEGERLYVAASGFADAPPVGPCAGLIVEFHVTDGLDGREAHATRLVPQIAPRRARRCRH